MKRLLRRCRDSITKRNTTPEHTTERPDDNTTPPDTTTNTPQINAHARPPKKQTHKTISNQPRQRLTLTSRVTDLFAEPKAKRNSTDRRPRKPDLCRCDKPLTDNDTCMKCGKPQAQPETPDWGGDPLP